MDLVRHKLIGVLEEAAVRAQAAGDLPALALPEITIEKPGNPEHGDYATSLPLKLARSARMNPVEIAARLARHAPAIPEVEAVRAAAPGFINFVLSEAWLQGQVRSVLTEGEAFGNIGLGTGKRVQVEFVSVNPTGPVHIGHGRGAVLGSTLANIMEAAGYSVQREYYINDAGNQMDMFYRSLYARAAQQLELDVEVPANGYGGAYMVDLARQVLEEAHDRPELERVIKDQPDQAIARLAPEGLRRMLAAIRDDLAALGVTFDIWFSERSLFESGEYELAMEQLRQGGHVVSKEGAVWFAPSGLGEGTALDKDNVLVRSNGTPTYFASDIAYHRNKFIERGFDQVIDIWGADHHGHVPRMKAAAAALGIDPARLTIILSQLVTLKRGGEIVRISKRTGDLITLKEVIDEVGADPCRFFLLSSSANSQMDFDMELAKTESQDNPVYYVQYAHARISSILRHAKEQGIDYSNGNVSLLKHEAELGLVRSMLELPELIETAAKNLEPHHLPHYASALATAFHSFYRQCRVISADEPAVTAARLKLVDAARVVLARTLHLMGMSAPEQM